ncbi:Mitochondrial adenine nucleotide transporter ADNT1 [Apostasia shenzhenica]|uniref:Mitochondrial adenine nucleotide transporter ADNT1 n=1 Tax=Apostasia shenzhenica TaxID=1088818 RepID=A0A2I0BFV2_9ASPA|nr:Mitochondrial adenine nucleotide transporter ADNT1 [Apostasia shenzhenica]
MASDNVVAKRTGESVVTTIVNLAEEAKLAREGVKAKGRVVLSICGPRTKPACGAAVGMVGQTLAYPLDVVRRRMQMVGWKDAGTVRKGQVVPSIAIAFVTYEIVKDILGVEMRISG